MRALGEPLFEDPGYCERHASAEIGRQRQRRQQFGEADALRHAMTLPGRSRPGR